MMPKLRAYDKVTQKIFDVEYINFTEQVVSLGGCRRRYFHEVENMQAAGFTDKKGDEIYEGDIIRIDGGKLNDTLEDLGEEIGVIRFTEGAFYIDYHGLDTDFELLSSVELPTEVIGNIYENPELVEG